MKFTIIKQQNYGMFNVQLGQDEHGEYSVRYWANGILLEKYERKDQDAAENDYITVCDAIRNVLSVIRKALG